MKHPRRPSQQDLEDQGVVAEGYFVNHQGVALTRERERRKLFTTYSNDDISGSFVYYCFMICGMEVLNPSALSSLSYVIPVILTFTQRAQ